MAKTNMGARAIAVALGTCSAWTFCPSVHADVRNFLYRLGGSAYADDPNIVSATREASFVYEKSLSDFPGGPAYSSDKTFLGFEGCLENKATRKAIPNAVITLVGAGLPAQVKTDSNGIFRATSTSPADEIRAVIKVAGYEPYSLVVFRQSQMMGSYADVRAEFRLTPIPSALPDRIR